MIEFLDWLLDSTKLISDNIWWPAIVILLFGCGVIITIASGFIQIRKLPEAIKLIARGAVGKDKQEGKGDITPFQALMTALSATVGNGNIAGVATAIFIGGPGAIFWMWLTAVFGMATKYAEAVLGQVFRVENEDGTFSGGAMYYCREGIRWRPAGKFLGAFFAVAGAVTAILGTGNMAQSNSMTLSMLEQFKLEQGTDAYLWASVFMGLVICVLVGAVILGGVKRIGAVAEKLVPTMILLYFGGAITIILMNAARVPWAIGVIVGSAFTGSAALGGFAGASMVYAIRYGVSRGVLSNESGLGSASIAHGAARTDNPVRQGAVAMMGTFIDTIIVCSLTALVIVLSGAMETGYNSIALTRAGFESQLGLLGGTVVSLGSFLFGFSTLLGWCYYGEQCIRYLLGSWVIRPYRVIFIFFLFMGAILQGRYLQIVWNIGDISNAFMAFPNLVGLILLSGMVGRLTRRALKRSLDEPWRPDIEEVRQ
jgi:AGCS family alanine or glycine:cation symporter